MIATGVTYDLIFIVHVLTAVAVIAVFVTMRLAGQAIVRGATSKELASKFPSRTNWAARLVHLLALTGIIMALTGGKAVSFSRPWVGVGLLCYLLAAGHLEARALPFERQLSRQIAETGTATPAQGRKFVISIDTLLAIIAVALLAMLVQF